MALDCLQELLKLLLQANTERDRDIGSLTCKGFHGNDPTLVLVANAVALGNAYLVQEYFAKLAFPGNLPQGLTLTPGLFRSTIKAEMPLCRGACVSVLASRICSPR